MAAGRIEYAQHHGSSIAYQVFGDGPTDVVVVQPYMSAMRLFRRASGVLVERLAHSARVILFDRRGTGMSDPLPLDDLPTIDDWSEDIFTVMDAVGSERAALVGFLGGGQMSISASVRRPERVTHLVLMHTQASSAPSPDYPWGITREEREVQIADVLNGWRIADHVHLFGADTDPESYRRHMQQVGSPAVVAAVLWHTYDVDVREQLPALRVPTLVLQRRDNQWVPLGVGRYIAEHIPGAQLVVLPGDAQNPGVDMEPVADEIEEFLTGSRPAPEPERVLAAVLFTDIVSSTDSKVRTGDKRWRALLADHNEIIWRQVERHGGRVVNTAGDGFLATFDASLRAIRCAKAIIGDLVRTGLHIRAGVHAGEIERIGDDITGITVDIGARVSALAGPDEILVSSTVHDMAIGSSIAFKERGEHELKGVPGRWRIYAVTD